MISIQYPPPNFKIRKESDRHILFDPIRKAWVQLTPEEWVRQNFIQFLVQVEQLPASWIAVEKEILLGAIKKRFDLLVYNEGQHPWMLIECKAEAVVLTQDVLEQVLRYSITIPPSYIVITNGPQTRIWKRIQEDWKEVDAFPKLSI